MTEPSQTSVPTQHFEKLYEQSEDPWEYEHGRYEQAKYARTLGALPRRHYPRAFELGCSIGVLTEKLSRYCDHILGGDCAQKAIALARRKHAHPNIEFRQMRAPGELPFGEKFDLILLSEVLYFFSRADLEAVAAFVRDAANLSATITLVNYLGPTEHAFSGDEAADGFIDAARPWTKSIAQIREAEFRIDVLERIGAD